METVKLNASKRDLAVKAKDYRNQDKITISYYGKGTPNLDLAVDYQEFRRAYKQAGKSTVIELTIDGKETVYALVHEVDYHPVTDKFTHVDLLHVDLNKTVDTKIPLEFTGTSLAVKDLQGTLAVSLDALDVRCLAKDLIHSITVDVSPLVDFNAVIRVKDVVVPSTITVMSDPELVVITATPVKEEKVEEVVAAADIPVTGEKKPEEGAADATAAGGGKGGAAPAAKGGGKDKK